MADVLQQDNLKAHMLFLMSPCHLSVSIRRLCAGGVSGSASRLTRKPMAQQLGLPIRLDSFGCR